MRAILSDAITMYHFNFARSLVAHSPQASGPAAPAGPAEAAPALFFKRCVCGVTFTEAAWQALPVLGYQDCGEYRLEYRNCPDPCGSTLAIEVVL
jgi:hypothetical protein